MQILSKILAISFVTTSLAFSWAQASTSLSTQQWEQLTQKAILEGERQDTVLGTTLSLTYKEVISETSNEVVYFTVLGKVADGSFLPEKLSLVYEIWNQVGDKAQPDTEIEQRSYIFDQSGTLLDLWHRKILKTAAGGLKIEQIPTEGIESPAEHHLILRIVTVFAEGYKPATALQP